MREFESNQEAVSFLQADFREYWATAPISTKISWEELQGDTQKENLDVTLNVADRELYKGEAYVEYTIEHTNGRQVAMGRPKYEHEGLIVVGVHGEQDRGRAGGTGLIAEQALAYFQSARNGVALNNANLSEVGNVRKWYKMLVVCEFLYQVKRPVR